MTHTHIETKNGEEEKKKKNKNRNKNRNAGKRNAGSAGFYLYLKPIKNLLKYQFMVRANTSKAMEEDILTQMSRVCVCVRCT